MNETNTPAPVAQAKIDPEVIRSAREAIEAILLLLKEHKEIPTIMAGIYPHGGLQFSVNGVSWSGSLETAIRDVIDTDSIRRRKINEAEALEAKAAALRMEALG